MALGLYRFCLLAGGLVLGFGLLCVGIYRTKSGNPRDLLGGLAIAGAMAVAVVVLGLW
jgi:hypothetical protein